MRFEFRIPSLAKRIAARTSVKRIIRHNLGFKAPREFGWLTDPKKALYNRIYTRTSRGCLFTTLFIFTTALFISILISLNSCTESNEKSSKKTPPKKSTYVEPTVNYKGQVRKGYVRKPVSTDKNAIKNQNRARYYYQTRGKYRRK